MEKTTQKIKDLGYDGVIMRSEYVVFEPNQIRLIKENGRESLNNKSISRSEYKIIQNTLNQKLANKPLPKSGYSQCHTANFVYKVKVIDYNEYKPISRRRLS